MKLSTPFIATIMAASANTFASAYDPTSDRSADASTKSAKSAVVSDNNLVCNLAKNELAARLAYRIAVQITALANGLPLPVPPPGETMYDITMAAPRFNIDDVVLDEVSMAILPILKLNEEILMSGDGIFPPQGVADGILTYQELIISMTMYVQGWTCEEVRELVVAGAGVGALVIGLAGAGVGSGTAYGWPHWPHSLAEPTRM